MEPQSHEPEPQQLVSGSVQFVEMMINGFPVLVVRETWCRHLARCLVEGFDHVDPEAIPTDVFMTLQNFIDEHYRDD